jgi:hypothetical protein
MNPHCTCPDWGIRYDCPVHESQYFSASPFDVPPDPPGFKRPTEEEFYANPEVCQGCKDYWREHKQPSHPYGSVCIDCAKLSRT